MAFLFEPYNAYQKPPKKKHWMEIAEEEALLHRINLEEQARQKDLFHEALKQHLALREANAKQNPSNLNNQNIALPQYAPQPASQQVQDGQFAAPAGGGGWVIPFEHEKEEVAYFSATPQSGFGPLTVTFVNLTPSPENDTFLWIFGSGSLTTSSITPLPLIYTQTGSYTVTLQETSSAGVMTATSKTITVSDPTLVAALSLGNITTPAPYSASITGSHTYNGYGTVSGFWSYGDGTAVVPYTASAGVLHIYTTGSWTASLALTESGYNHTSVVKVNISASLPWLTALFTVISESIVAPSTASFDNTSTYYVNDTFEYRWVYGDGTTNSQFEPPHVYSASNYAVRLEITESYYGITSVYVLPGGITQSAPTLNPLFTVISESIVAPSTASFTNLSTQVVNVNDSYNNRWVFGDGTTTTGFSPTHVYSASNYAVRLEISESYYGIKSVYVLPGGITQSAPSLTPLFTADVVTGTAPLPVTFSNASTQVVNVNDSYNNQWVFGDGTTTTTFNPKHEYALGEWPVRLNMTESYYSITANYTLPAGITGSL